MNSATSIEQNSLRYGFGETPVGLALVAESGRGIAAVLLGDDKAKLRRELSRSFPDTELIEEQASLTGAVDAVTAFAAAPRGRFAQPLDIRGTEQQLAVWEELRSIPSGETRSYGALAKVLPLPATAQEVGAACAANVLAIVVPCHRVLKADGSISGYRWGVQRKRQLLNMEAAV